MENHFPAINETSKVKCESPMTEAGELKVSKHKNGKSPGSDGLTSEFYKLFWNDIKQYLLESINHTLLHGKLSVEQKRGSISLLPKKDKDRLYLKNRRPISQLNTDYKILAKALANMIINYIPDLIKIKLAT